MRNIDRSLLTMSFFRGLVGQTLKIREPRDGLTRIPKIETVRFRKGNIVLVLDAHMRFSEWGQGEVSRHDKGETFEFRRSTTEFERTEEGEMIAITQQSLEILVFNSPPTDRR